MLHFILFHKIKNVIVFSFFFLVFSILLKKIKKFTFFTHVFFSKKKNLTFLFLFFFSNFFFLLEKKKKDTACVQWKFPLDTSGFGHVSTIQRVQCKLPLDTSHTKKKNSYYKATTITSPSISLNLGLNC